MASFPNGVGYCIFSTHVNYGGRDHTFNEGTAIYAKWPIYPMEIMLRLSKNENEDASL